MGNLERRVTRLEEKANMKEIPAEDKIQVIEGHQAERAEKIRRLKAQLCEKYGPQALEEIQFVEIIDRFPDEEAQA